MEIPIVFENNDLLVINKPPGLVVHADGRTQEATLGDWLLLRYPDMKEVGEPLVLSSGEVIPRPGIVHRIDRETSGVLVIAKNQKAFLHLKEQFQCRTVEKTYLAFVWGEIKKDEETIDRPIGRSKSDFRQWSAQRGARGEMREAVTYYKTLARKNGFSLIEVNPKTGRTHQIRVHMKAVSHPLVGDKLYAPKQPEALGFTRVALHAERIAFKDLQGDIQEVSAPLPADFEAAFKELEIRLPK